MLKIFAIFALLALAVYAAPEKENRVAAVDYQTFYGAVRSSNRTYSSICLFYLSTISFSNGYKEGTFNEVALNTGLWRESVRFFSIDCFDTNNSMVCDEYGFRYAPLVMHFKPNSDKQGTRINSYTNSTFMLATVMNEVKPFAHDNAFPKYDELSTDIQTLDDLWHMLHDECRSQILLIPVDDMDQLSGHIRLIRANQVTKGKLPIYRVSASHPFLSLANSNNTYFQDLLLVTRINSYGVTWSKLFSSEYKLLNSLNFADGSRLVANTTCIQPNLSNPEFKLENIMNKVDAQFGEKTLQIYNFGSLTLEHSFL